MFAANSFFPDCSGETNVVSEKWNSLAICCMTAGVTGLSMITTANWFPEYFFSPKTSTI
jgi:hypothetical protein